MAGDWIKMKTSLDTSPEVCIIAAELGVDELHVCGMLFKVWAWADQHSVDGNAVSVTTATLDRFVRFNGFADALRKAGWLEGRDSALTFPRFSENNGHTAKKRAQTAKRVAKSKSKDGNAKVTQTALPREEKRREEKSTKKECEDEPDLGFDSPSAQQVQDYIDFRSGMNPNWPRNDDLSGESFVDHYDAQGWLNGNGMPIKDWKAKVRSWGNKAPKPSPRGGSKASHKPTTFGEQKSNNVAEANRRFIERRNKTQPAEGKVLKIE